MTDTKPQIGENRDAMLGRIRAALGRNPGDAVADPPIVDESLTRLASSNDDLLAIFTQRAEEVGMKVHRITADILETALTGVLNELDAKRVLLGTAAVGERFGIETIVHNHGCQIVDWQARPGFATQYDTDVGITDVHAALAETGTLIVASDARHSRGLSLVPPHHVALVRASDVLPDMLDYWNRLAGLPPTELPSSQAFITGPSKTADIEGMLITGVHGPGSVNILLIEDV